MRTPRILIGATGSGSGKTTITCALLEILKRQGKKVQAFKCGPDYIDPMFHRTVLGIPSKNLDTFFTGEKMTAELFMESAVNADISVMEGVMGLYDGLGGIRKEGSAYDLATVTDTPVILVIDAHGMGRSILPLIAGFLSYDTIHLIRGIILNRTSGAFFETIRPEIEKSFPVEVLGYFPNQKEILLESRHLGLKRPEEVEKMAELLDKTADMLEKSVDIDRLFAIAEGASELPEGSTLEKDSYGKQKVHLQKSGKRPVIAVARDEAFCFYYEDNLKALEKAGAEIVFFHRFMMEVCQKKRTVYCFREGTLNSMRKNYLKIRRCLRISGKRRNSRCRSLLSVADLCICIRRWKIQSIMFMRWQALCRETAFTQGNWFVSGTSNLRKKNQTFCRKMAA